MSNTTIQQVGANLKKVRVQKGLTQAEVAKKAGMGTNRYAVVERGEANNMTLNKLEKIVKALGVKSSDVLPF